MGEPNSLDVPPRDVVILKARVANPSASTRELSELLEEKYGISLSHNRINEILRSMAEEGIFREAILPTREIFQHYLFRIAFNFPAFESRWRESYEAFVADPHVLMFYNADSTYHWQVIAQFRSNHQMERWVHELFKAHGELLDEFDITMLHNIHKFQTDAAIFDDLLAESEDGQEYLRRADAER